MKWGVVVAAGGREEGDLATAMGTPFKPMAPVGGKPAICWMVEAVQALPQIELAVVGPLEVGAVVPAKAYVPEVGSAVQNLMAGLDSLKDCNAIVVLPGDSPLIRPESLENYIQYLQSRALAGDWISAGICPASAFRSRYPECPASGIHLKEGEFISGGLYAGAPATLRRLEAILAEFRALRKNPIAMVRKLGFIALGVFALRQASLGFAEYHLARIFESRALIWPEAGPETCFDFDTPEEYAAILRYFPQTL
ncbi:MAG: NTP transferase domain-containing protein [Armatimonadetes bacterium]|nr:NTP transferase domain-containing protein [Armatimonadota bacterium]